MKPEDLGNPDMLHMKWGRRWKYNYGIFIDEVHDEKWPATFLANRAGRPSENIGHAGTLAGAMQLACYYLDSKELEILQAQDPFEKVREHLDHSDCFEIAVYGDEADLNITVECVKCNVVLHELYNKENDHGQNTSPPQCE